MCGRYSLTTAPEAMRQLFALSGPPANLAPRYNIAPSQEAPVVRPAREGGGRELAFLRWGLVPAWSKGPDSRYSMINARAETVAEKPSFRAALRHRRCLVPADGFYEWQRRAGAKQPYRIGLAGGAPFAFAGLWEHWHGAEGDEIQSFTIITTAANAALAPIHDRMPVILERADYGLWLEGGPEATTEAQTLLHASPDEATTAYPVSSHVNNPRNDDARCIAELAQT